MNHNRHGADRRPSTEVNRNHSWSESRFSWISILACLGLVGILDGAGTAWAQSAGAGPSAPASQAAGADALAQYDIAPGSLDQVLGRYAAAAGVALSANAGLTAGKQSDGLRGRYSVEQGFDHILSRHGIQAVQGRNQVWSLRRAPRSGDAVSVLTPVRISGRRDPREQVYQTPASVAVVTREDIDRLPPRNTSDLLRETAGVFTSQGRGDPGVSVNIRGMQDFGRVNVMIDGARQNFQQSGHGSNGQVYVDAALLGGVDIVKGPVSTVGGAGMIAGMVNFRTLDVDDLLRPGQQVGGKVDLSTGSNAYNFVGSAAGAARVGESTDFLVAVSRKSIGEFKSGSHKVKPLDYTIGYFDVPGLINKESGQSQWSGLVKGTWRLANGQRLKLSYLGLDARFDNGQDVESSSDFPGSRSEQFKVRSDTLKLDYAFDSVSPWLDLESSVYYTRTQRGQTRDVLVEDTGDVASRFTQYKTETIGGSVQNRMRFQRGGMDMTWIVGGELFQDRTLPSFQDSPAAGATAYEARWYTGPTPQGKRMVASLFTELQADYQDWLQVIGGLRYDWYSIRGDGEIYIDTISNPPGVWPPTRRVYTNFEVARHEAALAPKLTVAVKPVPAVQVYASYGQGLRPPALTESLQSGMHALNMFPFYPNPDLREERSRTWEVGVNLQLEDVIRDTDTLRMKVAWFHSTVKNFIIPANVMAPTATVGCASLLCPNAYVNLLDPAKFHGLELQLDYDAQSVFGGISLSYTKMNLGQGRYDPFPLGSWVGYPPNDMGTGGEGIYGSVGTSIFRGPPKLRWVTQAGVRPWNGDVELGVRYRVEIASESDRPFRPHPTRAWDVWATWHVTDALTLRLAVDNLLDTHYTEMAGAGGAFAYAPGRTAIASASWRF